MSDFDVDKMIEKQSGAVQFNSSGEWVCWTSVGGMGGEWGRGNSVSSGERQQENSHFSQCINLPRMDGSGGEEGEEEIQTRIK